MKKNIIGSRNPGPGLVDASGEDLNMFPPLPKIAGVRPVGSLVLLEILDEQEVLGTKMILPSKSGPSSNPMYGAPQAWVRAVGPGFKAESFGYDVGDRVLLSTGVAVPCPQREGEKRDWVLVEPGAVRGVIIEESNE